MPQRPRVKICCISSPTEASMAADAGADFLGLVGPMPSGPGVLDHDEAHTIARSLNAVAKPILLTSSETAEDIAADAARVGVTHVQVVRHIAASEAKRLAASPLTYFQVIHVEDETALDLIEIYAPYCNTFLLDSGRPSQATLGGTGNTHDWRISAEFVRRSPNPTFLAGGLTAENVADAVATVRPYGLDLCSRVRRDGHLDPFLLSDFMRAVKCASA